MRIQSNHLIILCSTLLILSVGLWYKLFTDINAIKNQIYSESVNALIAGTDNLAQSSNVTSMNDVANSQQSATQIKSALDATCTKLNNKKIWSEFQHELKDTVVQVFSNVTEFNWLEPYKSPTQSESSGTAFFIDNEGKLITNAHVVNQAKVVFIQIPSTGKRRFEVEVLGISPERDLALLKVKDIEAVKKDLNKKDISFLAMGDSDLVNRADKIMALGYPLGQQGLKSTTGVVSGREHLSGHYYIQISAPLNPGNSGGPSLDIDGKIVGVNTSGIQGAQNVGYIIPINEVKLFLEQLNNMPAIDGGPKLLHKPFLGVLFNNANENLVQFLGNPLPGGLYILDVYKGSPLFKAGLQAGDMIYKINNIDVDIYGEMKVPWSREERISIIDYVARLTIGQKINIEFYRKGVKKFASFKFNLTEKPPIRLMYPGYEKVDYEMLAGLTVMPLTVNHILLLAQYSPELMQYADMKKHIEPALIITNKLFNSPAYKTRTLGVSLISEVNGEKVKTLDQFRNAVKKSIDTGYLTIKTSENIFVAMPIKDIIESEESLASVYFYPVSKTFRELQKAYLEKQGASAKA